MKLWHFWKWPAMYLKLVEIRKVTSVHFNDSRFIKITEIIDQ